MLGVDDDRVKPHVADVVEEAVHVAVQLGVSGAPCSRGVVLDLLGSGPQQVDVVLVGGVVREA